MRRPSTNNPRLSIRLKLFLDGKMIVDTTKWSVPRIRHNLEAVKFDKGYLKVLYQPRAWNIAEFTTVEDGKWYLSTFTEQELVDYIQQGDYSNAALYR